MSFSIGRIMGITVRIHYTLWFVFLLIAWTLASGYMPQEYPGLSIITYWSIGIASAILLFVSVLIHELSHSYIANKNNLPIKRITLFFFGGVSEMSKEPIDPSLEIRMAAAGPLMSFLIAGVLGALWFMTKNAGAPIILTATLRYGALINAILGAFNLLPAFPLDGGRVLRGSLWKRSKSLSDSTIKATRVAEYLAFTLMGLGLVFAIFGNFIGGIWLIFIGWFIKSGAEESMQHTLVGEMLSGILVKDVMTKDVLTVPPEITVEQMVSNYFLVHRHGGYPVLHDDEIDGIITMQCVRSIPKEKWSVTTVKDAMVPCERTIILEPNVSALDAFNKMASENVGRILIASDNRLLGILTRGDLMRIIRAKQELGLP
jgi:Zn-dependent protease/predicted transcriptional regulator